MSSKKRKGKLDRRAHATFVSGYKKGDGTYVRAHSRKMPEHRIFKLVRKPETDEWVVKAYDDGVYNEGATYYTNEKDDAIDTKKEMVKAEIDRRKEIR